MPSAANKCRELEMKADEARAALMTAKPVQSADPGSERLAAVLGVDEAKIQLYVPLLLPIGLEFGGFIFLAFGFAPRRQIATQSAVIATEAPVVATEPVASAMQIIATAAAMPAKAGTKAYYLHRLQRDFPELAEKIASGEMSVYAAGLRKAPAKASKWTKTEAYMPRVDAGEATMRRTT